MNVTAKEVAGWVNGQVIGNDQQLISGISKIEELIPNTISFLANNKYEKYLYNEVFRTILIDQDFLPQKDHSSTLIMVANVYEAIGLVLTKVTPRLQYDKAIDPLSSIEESAGIGNDVGIGKFSIVSANARIGDDVIISDQVFIGLNVSIGTGTVIYPGVRIHADCTIGNNVVIYSNSVIGSDGFGFSKTEKGMTRIPQTGNVIIGNNVEIGANCCIDRATIGSTIIEDGAKIDNLVQVAHNVRIGANAAIAAQVGISGSSVIGKRSLIGGQSGIAGHVTIADGTQIQAQSGVPSDITIKDHKWYGYPVMKYFDYLRSFAVFKKLPDILRRVEKLEKDSNR